MLHVKTLGRKPQTILISRKSNKKQKTHAAAPNDGTEIKVVVNSSSLLDEEAFGGNNTLINMCLHVHGF